MAPSGCSELFLWWVTHHPVTSFLQFPLCDARYVHPSRNAPIDSRGIKEQRHGWLIVAFCCDVLPCGFLFRLRPVGVFLLE